MIETSPAFVGSTPEQAYRRPLQSFGHNLAVLLVMAYGLLVPLIVVPIGGERFGLCEPLMLPCLLALCLVALQSAPKLHHLAMAMFLVAAMLSLVQIVDGEMLLGSAKRWLRLLAIVSPFFLSLILPVTDKLIVQGLRAFFVGGAAAIVCGFFIYWLQIPIYADSQKLWLANGQAPVLRASGLVGDTASFGHLISLWCLLAIGSLWLDHSPGRTWKSAAVLAVVAYAVLVSSSRAALLNVVGGLWTLWMLSHSNSRAHRNGIVVAGMLLTIAFVALSLRSMVGSGEPGGALAGSLDRFLGSEQTTANGFASGRLESWSSYLFECSEYLLLGTGYKTAHLVVPGHFADNALLGVVVETGLPGLFCMLLLLAAIFYGLWRQHQQGNRFGTLLLAVWVGQMLHGLTADTFTLWTTMPELYLLTGLVLQMKPAVEINQEASPWTAAPSSCDSLSTISG
ncbi:O-Antigen ligase [Anatilimnocola aggregata]|uniref:O-Antigen ligase n=1 Tax=Anatilimnocola aggregata TaxID=2528021 RepID=A0A517YA71_9BACT|nr:O-antigen ligase family protein [Anatilimnocola aggregata]QDU27129.1 O-Antigen ligase [Anatilimnocola aggregata]